MTIEEHIENLKAIASDMPSDKCSDWIESLMAGVKSLEQEPCTDAISRQAAIDALTKTSGIRGDALKALYDLPPVKPAEKVNDWIPVSERYPEDGQRVLVDYCDEDAGIMLIRFNVNGYHGFKAWMPLPERYRQEVKE